MPRTSGDLPAPPSALADPRLVADCSACAALCCVVLRLTRSHDFAIDKPAGTPCPHLRADDRCGIHDRLRPEGFAGCVTFDCFGAGQLVTQDVYAGRPGRSEETTAVLGVVRAVQEALFLLRWTAELPAALPHAATIADLADELAGVAADPPARVLGTDLAALRGRTGALLGAVSRQVRAPAGAALAGADLMGTDLRGRDLGRADLRGALLVGADLRDCVLDRADLLGADLRGADLRGADLTGSLFLTRPQLAAATGDPATGVPVGFGRPVHWA